MKYTYIFEGSFVVEADSRLDADRKAFEALDKMGCADTTRQFPKGVGPCDDLSLQSVQWDENGRTQEQEL